MREIERIDRILNKLSFYWKSNPDLRLFQIFGNSFDLSSPFHYYIEDSVIEEDLDFLIEDMKKGIKK